MEEILRKYFSFSSSFSNRNAPFLAFVCLISVKKNLSTLGDPLGETCRSRIDPPAAIWMPLLIEGIGVFFNFLF